MNVSVSQLTGIVTGFLDDKKGAALALVAMAAVPIIASIGIASDVARGYLVKNRLTEAVDAASLAAGRQADPALRQGDAERFFWANFGQDYLGTTITSGPTVVSDDDAGTVTVTATAEVPTTFMSAVGYNEVNIGARAVVNRQLNGMELVLVMDNTGSMGNDGKISAMREAAKDLLQILYGDAQTIDDVWVGLVPYVTMVNVGDAHTNWLDAGFDISQYDQDPRGWMGCVIARPGTGDRTDDPPSVDPIVNYFWPSDASYPHWNDWYNRWPAVVTDEGAPWWSRDARGPNRGCVTPITSLNPYRDRVEAAIDQMQPHNYGGTMINIGLVWGWRAISPRWRGLWGGDTPASLPLDYDEPDMNKVIILLTDGMNVFNTVDYTAYRKLPEGALGGATSYWAATAELNNRTAEVCAAVKAAGIQLYTITFQQDDPTVQNLMRSCASEPHDEHYFDSPTNEVLVENFKLIAGKLSKLRVAE